MTRPQYIRWTRRIMIVMAAAPLLQLPACQTAFQRVGASFANSLPSTIFSIFQQAFLAPFFAIVGGAGLTA